MLPLKQTFHLCIFAFLAANLSCGSKKTGKSKSSAMATQVATAFEDLPDGLQMELSEGVDQGQASAPNPIGKGSKLSDAEANQILKRVAAPNEKKEDQQDFALREGSKPPPKTGTTVNREFPASSQKRGPSRSQSTELKVVRFAPEGDVPIAPHVSLTFNQPMVAVTSQGDAQATIPVKMTPQVKGKWRWLGTKTLLFDPEVRMPMATEYQIEVSTKVASETGGRLSAPFKFSFKTPTPTIVDFIPGRGPQTLEPLIAIRFDQRISKEDVASRMRLDADSKTIKARLASKEEIADDKDVKAFVERAEELSHGDRTLVVRPLKELPKNKNIHVVVPQGTPSAEGPRLTKIDDSFSFQTYGPFSVERTSCGWNRSGTCPPGSPWNITMTNPIDEDAFDADLVAVSPDVKKRIAAQRSSITLSGPNKARTTYTVTLPKTLRDTFGQELDTESMQTFVTGSAEPTLQGPNQLTVLDPGSPLATYSVHSVNIEKLSVKVYKVNPNLWKEFTSRNYYNPRKPVFPPGVKTVDTVIEVDGPMDEMIETKVDISSALSKAKLGHAIVWVEPVEWPRDYKPRALSWVQATKIGLDAFAEHGEVLTWATDLMTGRPLSGVKIRSAKSQATTGKDGLARISRAKSANAMFIAEKDGDTAFLPNVYSGWGSQSDSLQWFIFDDRAMYKPSETVHVKGWLRKRGERKGGDIGTSGKVPDSISYTVLDSRNNEIGKGSQKVTGLGGFDFKFKLPKTPNLGGAYVKFTAMDRGVKVAAHHAFQIQEFRRPEYEVTTDVSPGPYQVGKRVTVSAKAAYYAGGGLRGADIAWNVNASPTSFTPPNQQDYTFGYWTPWWHWRGGSQNTASSYEAFQSQTDSAGKHSLNIDFRSVKPARAMTVNATANVTDVNRQQWSSQSSFLLHPSDVYVGLKRDRYFVEKGKPMEFDTRVVNQEGKVQDGLRVLVQASLLSWEYENGSSQQVELNPQTCKFTSGLKDHTCVFQTPEGGTYQILATVFDANNRPSQTRLQMWVTGGKQAPERRVALESVTLVPDKKEYADGDVAEILVQSPFFPAEGILTLRRSGVVETRRFTLESSSTTLKVSIKDAYVPNLVAQVDLVGASTRVDDTGKPVKKGPKRPAFASGNLKLEVPPTMRTLKVSAKANAAKLAPGASTQVSVTVRDSKGQPVQDAEVAVVVVDESVLGLSGYKTPDPIAFFYAARSAGVTDYHQRQFVQLQAALQEPELADGLMEEGRGGAPEAEAFADVDEDDMVSSIAAPMRSAPSPAPAPLGRSSRTEKKRAQAKGKNVMANKDGSSQPAIAVRKNFNALALFAPATNTDASGQVTVGVKVPDNLTRYRIMAVAAAGPNHFGSGESSLTARMPLMVRPSAPRFLNFGDSFEFPIVLQNQTDQDMRVKVAMRATNAKLTDGLGREVRVPAQNRVEIRLPVTTHKPGRARFQIAAVSGSLSDAAEVDLPVWTPATTEAFATYGEIDGSETMRQSIKAPSDAIPVFGGLEVTTSSTQLQALTDAFVYLMQYPFECAEQTSSRVMTISALQSVLAAFEAKGLPSPAKIKEILAGDVKRLELLQNYDGGFAFWTRGRESWPYISIYASHALARAQKEGVEIPGQMVQRSKRYLQNIENHIPGFYSLQARRMLEAYALYVRKLHGDVDIAKAKKLFASASLKDFPLEAHGWLLMTLSGDSGSQSIRDKIHRYLGNQVTETAGNAHWTTSFTDGAHLILHSARRADGVLLQALIEDTPKSELIAKVVRGLLAHRVKGRWGNTQENTQILLAMDRYFEVFEKVRPNFVVDMWLGKGYAGQSKFRGRSTVSERTFVPMQNLGETKRDLVMQKKGKGRLYYRLGLDYAPTSLNQKAADYGFAVERSYEAIDDPGDVTRSKDGGWIIKAGAKVRVNLNMVAQARRYHVALVDPMPAGLEAMNPALKVTGTIPNDPNAEKNDPWWFWRRTWYEHQNMRDERVEAFTSLLPAGVHQYSYVARATTPGVYIVPPTKAEEMYAPETFGRSASDRVTVR